MSMLSCLTIALSTQFWPTAKQGINNRTINPIDFFGTIIQIPIYLFLLLSLLSFLLYCEHHFLYSALINIGEDEVVVQSLAQFHRLLVVARKTLRHFALLAVDELVDVLDGFVQRAHFTVKDIGYNG